MEVFNRADNNGEIGRGGLRIVKTYSVANATVTLTPADSGCTHIVTGGAGMTFLLPTDTKGFDAVFINNGAAGFTGFKVRPQGQQGIVGTITLGNSVNYMTGAWGQSCSNTGATSKKGDSIRVVGTGLPTGTSYVLVSTSGIWVALN